MTLQTARTIISGAQLHGAAQAMKPLTVVVLDAGGHVVAAERQDGSSIKRFEIANGKAFGALAIGMGSRALMVRAEQVPHFITAVGAAIGGALIPVPGGVLILDDTGVIGAVGISGDTSDRDEEAALAGIAAAGLTARVD
jgi:uncharacterized protein GlcG (DUF336 family)